MSEIPKFSATRKAEERARRDSNAPRSVDEMSWMQQKPANVSDVFSKRMGFMLVLAVVLGGGIFMVRDRAKTNTRGMIHDIEEATRDKEPALPSTKFSQHPDSGPVELVGPDGKPLKADVPAAEHAKTGAEEGKTGGEPAPEDEAEAKTGAAKTLGELDEERKMYSFKEGVQRVFKDMLPEFEPLEDLDPAGEDWADAYDMVFDEKLDSKQGLMDAHEIGEARGVLYLFYRFLRTCESAPEKFEAYAERRRQELLAKHEKPAAAVAGYSNVMFGDYRDYRGVPYRFQGSLIRKYQILNWTADPENKSGIRYTWLLICRDAKYKHYAVLVPQSMKDLISKDDAENADLVDWTGLFVQRWSFVRTDKNWDLMPLYAALNVKKYEAPSDGTTSVVLAIAALAAVGFIVVLRQLRRDEESASQITKRLRRKPLLPKGAAPAAAAGPSEGEAAPQGEPAGEPASGAPPEGGEQPA
ncbi:MAG: hypothetical protein M5U26_28955 [Planctomycetota bacterium]|nr:hypothetical protein [Planctomycetota bacterium]